MPTYTTLELLVKRLDPAVLAGLADDLNTPPSLADPETLAVVNQAITDGASLIDSYLLGRVELADATAAAALERMNATLALYFLYRRRFLDDSRNPLTAAKDMVQAQLAAVAQGEAHLGTAGSERPENLVYSSTEHLPRFLDPAALGRF